MLHLLLHVLRMLHLLQVVHVRGVQTYPVPTRCPRHRLNALSGWIKLSARVDSSRAVPGGPVARHRPRGRGRRGLRPRRSIEVRATGRRRARARHLRDQLLGRDDPTRHHRVHSLSLLPTSNGRRRSARRRRPVPASELLARTYARYLLLPRGKIPATLWIHRVVSPGGGGRAHARSSRRGPAEPRPKRLNLLVSFALRRGPLLLHVRRSHEPGTRIHGTVVLFVHSPAVRCGGGRARSGRPGRRGSTPRG